MHLRKVVVFGKGEAGKSTFIRTIIPDAVNIDHRGRTVGMDFGAVTVGNHIYHFYGTPGQARFDAVREVLTDFAHTALMIFDGSRPLDREDHDLFGELQVLNVPFFAVINVKQKMPVQADISEVQQMCCGSHYCGGVVQGDVMNSSFASAILTNLQRLS